MTVGTALVILVGVLLAARRLVPRLLAVVARTRERDLFILSVFLVCFGTAWALSLVGISLASGRFWPAWSSPTANSATRRCRS